MEHNFLPYWYKQNGKRKKNIVGFTIILGLVIVNTYLLYNFTNICENIDNLKTNESKFNLRYIPPAKTENEANTNRQVGTYKNFETFMGTMSNCNELCSLKTNGKDISAGFKVKDSLEYESLIRRIESDSKYKIMNLEPPKNDSDGNKSFQIDIEVVK